MKKYIRWMAVGFVSLLMPFGLAGAALAGGSGSAPIVEFTSSASSATADGSSKITFSVSTYKKRCAAGYLASPDGTCADGSTPSKEAVKDIALSIAAGGSGNTFGGTYTASNGAQTVKTGDDGKASFTLASNIAESKKLVIYFTEVNDPSAATNPSVTVTFNAPAPKPAPKPAPAPAPPAEVPAPEAPKTAAIETNGQPVEGQSVIVPADKSLTLKGTTVANGVVKLFIFSTPREVTVTADAQGNWTYDIAGLEPGSHHVEAEVTDPATGKTSARATLTSFTVDEPVAAPVAEQPKSKQKSTMFRVGAAVVTALVTAAAGLAVWWFVFRKKHASAAAGKNGEPPEDGFMKNENESGGNKE